VLGETGEHRVALRPNDPVLPFDVSAGPPREASGMTCDARTAWTRCREDFTRAGAGWFLPWLARMQAGARPAAGEVIEAFRRHHGRPPVVRRFPRI
jgi:hypothetical protein